MHGTSASLRGQLGFDSDVDSELECGVFKGLPEGDSDSVFLIHTNKSGGSFGSPFSDSGSVTLDRMSAPGDLSLVESSDTADLAERLVRYAAKVSRSIDMGQWIVSQPRWKNFHPVGRRVAGCGSYLRFHDYFRIGQVRLMEANNCCNSLLCPFCAGLRGARHLRKAVAKIRVAVGADRGLVPYLWTGTIRDERRCGRMFQRIQALLSKVLQLRRDANKGKRLPVCWAEFSGGIVSFETKRGSGSGLWHVHFHAIVLARPGLDPRPFQQAWSDVVGYWAQSDLRPLGCVDELVADPTSQRADEALADDCQEVFKYAVKCSDLSPEDNFEAWRDLRGKRLIRAFGCLFGLKFADDDVLDDVDELEGQPYRRLMFNLIASGGGGRHYTLSRSQVVSPGIDGQGDVVVDAFVDPVEFCDGDFC